MAIYAKFKGAKQGVISGSVTRARLQTVKSRSIRVDFGVGSPSMSPPARQRPAGRPAGPLTKPLDQSSPLLFTWPLTNEALTVEISYSSRARAISTM